MPEFRFPAALETEKRLLGACLQGREEPLSELVSDDFYDPELRKAYTAAQGLFTEGLAVTPLTVHERSGVNLEALETMFGMGHMGPTETQTLLKELKRVSQLRTIGKACHQATQSVGKDASLEEVVGALESVLYSVDHTGSSEAKDAADVQQDVIQGFMDRVANGTPPGIPTGLRELDKAIIGLLPGKLIVVAARPAMGKTALARSIGRNVTALGYGVIDFNLEMEPEELMEREISSQAGVNLRKILTGKVTQDELGRVGAVRGTQVSERWYIDSRTYSIAGIRRRARILKARMARQGVQLGLVVIDYIQLAGENGDGREQSVAAISRGCKLMAKELGCTVMALSQLNRACEARDDRRPMMSDLRESGTIEQDADIVMFVYRESQYDPSWPQEDAELIIRKQRNGPTGTVRVHYSPKTVSFVNDQLPVQAGEHQTLGNGSEDVGVKPRHGDRGPGDGHGGQGTIH